MANNPLEQFEIKEIVEIAEIAGHSIAFTNSSLFMIVVTAVVLAFVLLGAAGRTLVPGRFQALVEITYGFVENMLRGITGKEGMRFFPLVFSLFMFILTANLVGMFPYFFTVTSHIIVTFALAMMVFLIVIIYGFKTHGLGFLRLFVPSGVPIAVIPVVTAIEIISFFSRPLSLGIRLFANILAGHITLKVFAGFVVTLGSLGIFGIFGAILALLFSVPLNALEFLVAFLQAYVFALLTCIYLNDALHPGH